MDSHTVFAPQLPDSAVDSGLRVVLLAGTYAVALFVVIVFSPVTGFVHAPIGHAPVTTGQR